MSAVSSTRPSQRANSDGAPSATASDRIHPAFGSGSAQVPSLISSRRDSSAPPRRLQTRSEGRSRGCRLHNRLDPANVGRIEAEPAGNLVAHSRIGTAATTSTRAIPSASFRDMFAEAFGAPLLAWFAASTACSSASASATASRCSTPSRTIWSACTMSLTSSRWCPRAACRPTLRSAARRGHATSAGSGSPTTVGGRAHRCSSRVAARQDPVVL